MGLTERATEDREVLGVDADLATVDLAEAGDDAVGVGTRVLQAHARGDVAVQHVELLERVFVEEILETFSCGHATLGLMAFDRLLATRDAGFGLEGLELLETFRH